MSEERYEDQCCDAETVRSYRVRVHEHVAHAFLLDVVAQDLDRDFEYVPADQILHDMWDHPTIGTDLPILEECHALGASAFRGDHVNEDFLPGLVSESILDCNAYAEFDDPIDFLFGGREPHHRGLRPCDCWGGFPNNTTIMYDLYYDAMDKTRLPYFHIWDKVLRDNDLWLDHLADGFFGAQERWAAKGVNPRALQEMGDAIVTSIKKAGFPTGSRFLLSYNFTGHLSLQLLEDMISETTDQNVMFKNPAGAS